MTPPLVGWYGDDFTGASDTLATLTQAGLRAMLFLGLPTAARQQAAARLLGGDLHAVGIAGATRAMAPAAIAAELAPVGDFFAALRVPVLHYKVCSTFDSAPGTGSIGAALRALRPHVDNAFVPVVGGQPSLGRHCAFSNLFASAGAGGPIVRIDRHPTMSRHPVTPMLEADLRRHLALQGIEPVAALHWPVYIQGEAAQDRAVDGAIAQGAPAVLLDLADASHLAPVGRLIWQRARERRLLAIGASSVAQALLAHWQATRWPVDDHVPAADRIGPAQAPALVIAGSLSPVTARQVRAARSFHHIALAPADLTDAALPSSAARIATALQAGQHVLACTAPDAGPADITRSGEIAAATARLLRQVVDARARDAQPLRRIGIAGGDTSSLAVQALGVWGLSFGGSLGAGVTVSRAASELPYLDGVELMLKGGQMGGERVFEQLVHG